MIAGILERLRRKTLPPPSPAKAQPEPEAPPSWAGRQQGFVNDLRPYAHVFDGITPWSGYVPQGFQVDFLGCLVDAEFRTMWGIDPKTRGGGPAQTRMMSLAEDGDAWLEVASWAMAAREARDHFVMITLGACYGAQAVGTYRMLQHLNPMPCKFVAVEPVPENVAWLKRHFRDNGLDPDDHWIVPLAIREDLEPAFFPVGAPGTGAQNLIASNNRGARASYAAALTEGGPEAAKAALQNLLLNNTTGIARDLVPGMDSKIEIRLVSAITLRELLGPFDRVDFLEADIQQSEIEVFPPYIDLLRRKVRRIQIGTHGQDVHWALHDLFAGNGWEIVFSFEPNAHHDTALGSFATNDGVLTVINPDLARE